MFTQIEGRLSWLRTTYAALQTHLGTGAYVNYPDPDRLFNFSKPSPRHRGRT